MLVLIRYPNGEITYATGYPVKGAALVVDTVPRGPVAAYRDVVELDVEAGEPFPVTHVIDGPRRPTYRIRLGGTEAEIERWMEARETEGWYARMSDTDRNELWVVAERDGLDPSDLESLGATLLRESDGTGETEP